MQSYWKSKGLGVLWLFCICCLPDLTFGQTETVFLPVTLEYPFIRSVLIDQVYTAPGQRAIIIDEIEKDCVSIELSNPDVSPERSMIKVGSTIKIRAGIPILGSCMGFSEWEGYVEVLKRPVLDEKSLQVRFETVESRIYDVNRKPATIAGNLSDMIKAHVDPYLDQTTIDLAPPIKEMKDFLRLVFRPEERRRVERLIETLKPGPVQVEESAVKVNLQLEVQRESKPRASTAEPSLSDSEIEGISRAWEDWDAFLVFEIESLVGQPLTDRERASILEILLENRYAFLQALNDKTISTNLVRQQFIRTWNRFARILRKYHVNQQSRPSFGYLAFFTAADALAALDKLGPDPGTGNQPEWFYPVGATVEHGHRRSDFELLLQAGPRAAGVPRPRSAPRRFRSGWDVQEMDLPGEPEKNAEPDHSSILARPFPLSDGMGKRGGPRPQPPRSSNGSPLRAIRISMSVKCEACWKGRRILHSSPILLPETMALSFIHWSWPPPGRRAAGGSSSSRPVRSAI